MEMLGDLPVLLFASAREWDEWLAQHHAEPAGMWLRIAKKGCEMASVSYSDALDTALCHGWIDGQKKPCDERFWLQKFTPRRRRSGWSEVNTDRVAALIESGAMRPAGLAKVDAAKADGRWAAAYQSQGNATIPADFQAELDAHPGAHDFFAMLDKANRYAIYYRITAAKKPATRRSRIETFIAMLERGERLHP